jgi:dephospho-CoA kinase
MLVVGLTGSIGMGKSTAAAHLRARGVPVFDADAEVHDLYRGEAATGIEAAFPGTTGPEGVDRQRLSEALARETGGFSRLEAIVHPLVRRREKAFLIRSAASGADIAVLDVPLLYETGLDAALDAVIVVSSDADLQRQRVLARPGMTPDKLAQILTRQMPDGEKRRRAHFVVDTNGPPEAGWRQLDAILDALSGRRAVAFARHWATAEPPPQK